MPAKDKLTKAERLAEKNKIIARRQKERKEQVEEKQVVIANSKYIHQEQKKNVDEQYAKLQLFKDEKHRLWQNASRDLNYNFVNKRFDGYDSERHNIAIHNIACKIAKLQTKINKLELQLKENVYVIIKRACNGWIIKMDPRTGDLANIKCYHENHRTEECIPCNCDIENNFKLCPEDQELFDSGYLDIDESELNEQRKVLREQGDSSNNPTTIWGQLATAEGANHTNLVEFVQAFNKRGGSV
jgi:hypothetical protein